MVGRRRRCGAPGPGARGGARAPRPLGLRPRGPRRPVAPDAVATGGRRRGHGRPPRRSRSRVPTARTRPTTDTRSWLVDGATTSTSTTTRAAASTSSTTVGTADHDLDDARPTSTTTTGRAPADRRSRPAPPPVVPPRPAPVLAPAVAPTRPSLATADPPPVATAAVARAASAPTYTVVARRLPLVDRGADPRPDARRRAPSTAGGAPSTPRTATRSVPIRT